MNKRAYYSDESQTNLILILTFKIFLDLHSRFKHLLFDSPPIEPANIETTISPLLMETTIAKMIIRKGYVWRYDVWKYVTESGRLT